GNDFILIDLLKAGLTQNYLRNFAVKYCAVKTGIGADGVLVIEKSAVADFRMRIFNSDGSEAEMCGNGARCAALWFFQRQRRKSSAEFETKAGIIEAFRIKDRIKIKLPQPSNLKLGISLRAAGKSLKLDSVNTGVPHAVLKTANLDKVDIAKMGRAIRFHKCFAPDGTNVDFMEHIGGNRIRIRTYERGVEGETLACGTGSVASAIISLYRFNTGGKKDKGKIYVKVKSGETLSVYFERKNGIVKNVWLEGSATLLYKGEILPASAEI
ncbi:diaminopimelate epimerase, partial [bacterium]|nr:diaminopimelate epimerase [bacterium]